MIMIKPLSHRVFPDFNCSVVAQETLHNCGIELFDALRAEVVRSYSRCRTAAPARHSSSRVRRSGRVRLGVRIGPVALGGPGTIISPDNWSYGIGAGCLTKPVLTEPNHASDLLHAPNLLQTRWHKRGTEEASVGGCETPLRGMVCQELAR